jgi:hypothetical protein
MSEMICAATLIWLTGFGNRARALALRGFLDG